MTEYEKYTLVVSIFSALAGVGALIYVALQFKRSALVHKENMEWNIRIETRKKLDSDDAFKSRLFLDKIFDITTKKHTISVQEILEENERNHEVTIHIDKMLNFHESLSNGIHHNIYEESIVKSARKNLMINYYNLFKDYIGYIKIERSTRIFVLYEKQVLRWVNEDRAEQGLPKLGDV